MHASGCGHVQCGDKTVEKVAKIRGDILKIGRQQHRPVMLRASPPPPVVKTNGSVAEQIVPLDHPVDPPAVNSPPHFCCPDHCTEDIKDRMLIFIINELQFANCSCLQLSQNAIGSSPSSVRRQAQ